MTATDAEKLRTLADWFDKKDRQDLARELNVTESEVPDYMLSGERTEVQKDLRRIADILQKIRTEAEGWSKLAPPDDWGDADVTSAVVSDFGRVILNILDVASPLRYSPPESSRPVSLWGRHGARHKEG